MPKGWTAVVDAHRGSQARGRGLDLLHVLSRGVYATRMSDPVREAADFIEHYVSTYARRRLPRGQGLNLAEYPWWRFTFALEERGWRCVCIAAGHAGACVAAATIV